MSKVKYLQLKHVLVKRVKITLLNLYGLYTSKCSKRERNSMSSLIFRVYRGSLIWIVLCLDAQSKKVLSWSKITHCIAMSKLKNFLEQVNAFRYCEVLAATVWPRL